MPEAKPTKRVVVTGMGAVSAFGWGLDALVEPLFRGETAIRRHRIGGLPGAPETWAARLDTPLPPGQFDRRVEDADRATQMAVFAADEALGLAGLSPECIGAVAWGTGYGGATTLEDAYTRLFFGRTDVAGRVSPLTVPKGMTHAAAAGIAAHFGLECPVTTYSSACASSAVAIGEAFLGIRDGRFDVALVGGSEALITPGVVRAWEALSALAKPDDLGRLCGPFDKCRNGLVLGEGSGCLILESAEHARRRNASVLAEFAGYGNVNDPACITQPHAGAQAKAMRTALAQCGARADDVVYVNAHATGTRAGDAAEIGALNQVFEGCSTSVSSTKGATGHAMGAAGALEAVICVQAMRVGYCPPNVAVLAPENGLGFSLITRTDSVCERGVFLSNSFAFGGTNVSLAFKPFN